jgi:hypothetical protein
LKKRVYIGGDGTETEDLNKINKHKIIHRKRAHTTQAISRELKN